MNDDEAAYWEAEARDARAERLQMEKAERNYFERCDELREETEREAERFGEFDN